jgi:hypothetical protein
MENFLKQNGARRAAAVQMAFWKRSAASERGSTRIFNRWRILFGNGGVFH